MTYDILIPSTNISLERNVGPSRLDFIVAAIISDLSCGHHVDLHTKSLKAYGAAATAGLLPGLTDAKLRAVTLYALQHCWDPSALEPVAALLADPDLNTRQMAAIVVGKNAGLAELARLSKTLLDDQRPEIAGPAYERLEAVEPDLMRTAKIITQPVLWANISKFLPRYYSPSLTKHTRQMLGDDNLRVALPAIVSLINQNDDAIETRTRIAAALREVIAELREFSAEYLLWHGTLGETGFLEEAIGAESDSYALAAMSCALEAIKHRNTSINNACDKASKPKIEEPSAAYQHAIKILIDAATPDDRQQAFEIYRHAESVEPLAAHAEGDVTQEFIFRRVSRLRLQAKLFAIPTEKFLYASNKIDRIVEFRDDFCGEMAPELIPPVRDYFDTKRRSFGHVEKETDNVFGGLVHVGEDVSWYQDHQTVVAVANGLVRHVSCQASWGFMVIIEHCHPSGERFCSLYAHLGPYVCVKPGKYVRMGQKIGSIGRSFSWENGGYFSHLHFAIHIGWYWQIYRTGSLVDARIDGKWYLGRVVQSDISETFLEIQARHGMRLVKKKTSWISGYISKDYWLQRSHGWVHPQKFLEGRLAPFSGPV